MEQLEKTVCEEYEKRNENLKVAKEHKDFENIIKYEKCSICNGHNENCQYWNSYMS